MLIQHFAVKLNQSAYFLIGKPYLTIIGNNSLFSDLSDYLNLSNSLKFCSNKERNRIRFVFAFYVCEWTQIDRALASCSAIHLIRARTCSCNFRSHFSMKHKDSINVLLMPIYLWTVCMFSLCVFFFLFNS